MLAARDQENLVHGYQAAAAAKPLNQGVRQGAPKTPGNKAPKTPFKVPLNDVNATFGVGKAGLKTVEKSNAGFANKKDGPSEGNAFITPMAPRNRAPLGMKTTNAKAKAFQTPAPVIEKQAEKSAPRNASSRKAKPRTSHLETAKVDVLADKEDLEERDIEYMPPKAKDLPDIPDDFPSFDVSMFKGDVLSEIAKWHATQKVGSDGLTWIERQDKEKEEREDRAIRRLEAEGMRDFEGMAVECHHDPECPGELCKTTIKNRKIAKDKYEKTIASINAETAPAAAKVKGEDDPLPVPPLPLISSLARPKVSKATSTATSKPANPSAKARLNTTLASRPKKTPDLPKPPPMRHNAAVAASRTTVGYSQGRKTSTDLQKLSQNVKPATGSLSRKAPTTSLAPKTQVPRPVVPTISSKLGVQLGYNEEEELVKESNILQREEEISREMAEEDFELVLQD